MKTNRMFGCFVIFSTSLVALTVDGPRLAWGQGEASEALDPSTQALTNEVRAQADQIQAQAEQVRAQAEQVQAQAEQMRAQAEQVQAQTEQMRAQLEHRRTNNTRRSQVNNSDAEYRKAINKLQAATNEEEKTEAMKELFTQLDRHFSADMKIREKNIVDLETRVQKLRAQLDKRQAAKEKIIKLQLQVLSNEAEGLGFFGQSNRSRYSAWSQVPQIQSYLPRNVFRGGEPIDSYTPIDLDGPRSDANSPLK